MMDFGGRRVNFDSYYAPPECDEPEECPTCGKPNWDEKTEQWVCRGEWQGLCSPECGEEYRRWQEAEAEGYVKALEAAEKAAEEWQKQK
jgi:hypothetical protein